MVFSIFVRVSAVGTPLDVGEAAGRESPQHYKVPGRIHRSTGWGRDMIDVQEETKGNAETLLCGPKQRPPENCGQPRAQELAGCVSVEVLHQASFTASLKKLSDAVESRGELPRHTHDQEPPARRKSWLRWVLGKSWAGPVVATRVRNVAVRACAEESLGLLIEEVLGAGGEEGIKIDFSELVTGHWDCLSLSCLLDAALTSAAGSVHVVGWGHLFEHLHAPRARYDTCWHRDSGGWSLRMLALQNQFEKLTREHWSIVRARRRVSSSPREPAQGFCLHGMTGVDAGLAPR